MWMSKSVGGFRYGSRVPLILWLPMLISSIVLSIFRRSEQIHFVESEFCNNDNYSSYCNDWYEANGLGHLKPASGWGKKKASPTGKQTAYRGVA